MKSNTAMRGPEPIYREFWNWFLKNEKKFFDVVMKGRDIEEKFLARLAPKLKLLGDGFYFLTGLCDQATVELVFTADGNVKYMVLIEELVACAPKLKGWKFTAHKPSASIEDVNIEMSGFKFNGNNLSFYPVDHPQFPDEIDIRVVHHDFTEKNKDALAHGTFIFLDNFLGELNVVTSIDSIRVIGRRQADDELIPIEKLKSFLVWRQKEFVEKYEGLRHETANDNYTIFEAETENGKPAVAVVNMDLVTWDGKASHPWVLRIDINYGDGKDNGLPDDETYRSLESFERDLLHELKDYEGNLYLGRFTASGTRQVYFACKDFRKPAKVMHCVDQSRLNTSFMDFDLYVDKYWQSFTRLVNGGPVID